MRMTDYLKPKSQKDMIQSFCSENNISSKQLMFLWRMVRWRSGFLVWFYAIFYWVLSLSIIINTSITLSAGKFWMPIQGGINMFAFINWFWIISWYAVCISMAVYGIYIITKYLETKD